MRAARGSMPAGMALGEIELRILGCLIEKERTTPAYYPLSTNALVLACNQKSNRDPVTHYSQREVEEALQSLRDKGLVATVRADTERAFKHRHRLSEIFAITEQGLALLALLLLRGPQTPGELRSRAARYVTFATLDAVEAALHRLAEHQPPLAKNLGRGPGQSQDRWAHTLGQDEEKQKPRVRTAAIAPSEVEALRAEIAGLRALVTRLYHHLGLRLEDGADAESTTWRPDSPPGR